jgi:hypothetical protein
MSKAVGAPQEDVLAKPHRPFGGRPRKRGSPSVGERVPLGLRVACYIRNRIEAECKASGRSISHEVEMRLERSFWLDDLLKTRLISARVPAPSQPERSG